MIAGAVTETLSSYVLNGIWPSSGPLPPKDDVIGGLSAIIWSLTLLPLIKYVRRPFSIFSKALEFLMPGARLCSIGVYIPPIWHPGRSAHVSLIFLHTVDNRFRRCVKAREEHSLYFRVFSPRKTRTRRIVHSRVILLTTLTAWSPKCAVVLSSVPRSGLFACGACSVQRLHSLMVFSHLVRARLDVSTARV